METAVDNTWIRAEISAFGSPDNIKLVRESTLPQPAPDEVRVKVHAAGTGFTDTIIRQGQYMDVKEKPPFTLGYDWVGVVDAIGGNVTEFKVGDWVADMSVIGGYTQYLCVKAKRLVPCPTGLDPAAAVCMILSYTTAYQILTRECILKPGDAILVHAAGGAVGTALIELAQIMGLKVYGTASKSKQRLVERLGAVHIDYREGNLIHRIRTETGGKGVQAAFDTIGAKSWSRSYRCLARGGKLVAFGLLQYTTGEEKVPAIMLGFAKLKFLWPLLPDGKASSFYNIQHRRRSHPQEFRDDVETLMHWLKEGKLKPTIAAISPLKDAAEVHRQIDRAEIAGKVILDCINT